MTMSSREILGYALVVLALGGLSGCAPGVRTADGDCYYTGKGLLQIVGTIGDATLAWAEAEAERGYQQNRIALQALRRELGSVDFDAMEHDYNMALAAGDSRTASRIGTNINILSMKVQRAEILERAIERHQDRKKKELEDGPSASFSQMVDESGNCED